MKEFFLILFFARTIVLTPDPISLHDRVELVPDKSIEAITSGASIMIDVSSMVTWDGREDILVFRKRLLERFPSGSIVGKLIAENSNDVTLKYEGSHEFNEDRVMLSLQADSGVPTNVKFSRVLLESKIELDGIKVLWQNYKH